jgi:hypothetical protein
MQEKGGQNARERRTRRTDCKRDVEDEERVEEESGEGLIYNKKKMGLELLVGPGAFN